MSLAELEPAIPASKPTPYTAWSPGSAGFDPWTVHIVTSRYTDYTIMAHSVITGTLNK